MRRTIYIVNDTIDTGKTANDTLTVNAVPVPTCGEWNDGHLDYSKLVR